MIRENLTHTRQNMEDACRRAGRDAGDVTLIAVSKTKPLPMLQEAYEAGVRDFGENRCRNWWKNMKPFPGISAGI